MQTMSQSDSKIKNISSQKTISRDHRPRDVMSEESLVPAEAEAVVGRREVFKFLIPATGKALTEVLRSVGTTVGQISEAAKISKKF
jgi:hypothetical protein